MPEMCSTCVHRRLADQASLDPFRMTGIASSQRAAANRVAGELMAARRLEELAYQRTGIPSTLPRRPIDHDWCSSRSNLDAATYYFCEWLGVMKCAQFEGRPGTKGMGTRPQTTMACGNGSPPDKPRGLGKSMSPADAGSDWCVSLGTAQSLRSLPSAAETDASGSGAFELDYQLVDSPTRPEIRGKGLAQTYLIFGGPGAGKTYYFKYLLSSLLAEPRRPGCLLLDPKGALTGWLRDTLDGLGRATDLTVLEASATQNAFNVFGSNLAPVELGRLLSEVVLAGAAGIDEGWAVLVSDLLEASAVVISADVTTKLTARTLLGDILYRRRYVFANGKKDAEYPIVIRAARIARLVENPDVRIACDRIAEYFSSTEPRQRRFVRQIIERSLGSLMSSDWAYLSDEHAGTAVYSDIIHNHRIVSVAVGQGSPTFQRSMSTLLKALFQQAALADLSARKEGEAPFFILASDEYAQVITEGETGLVSDSRFFSLSREAGCMSLLALQSVATGRSRFPANMHDRWEAILGNVTVKLFMRVNDVETAELGSALAGSQHSFIPVSTQQRSAQGLSATESVTPLEHRRVPPWYLTNRMPQGLALVHGTLDGQSIPTSIFVRVPKS